MISVGKLCVKLMGRDAGKECLIVDIIDKTFVLIDGNTRRRKCNSDHLEILPQKADIKKGASHEEVVKALEKLGVKIIPKSPAREKKKVEETQAKQGLAGPKKTKKGFFREKEAPKKKPLLRLPGRKKPAQSKTKK